MIYLVTTNQELFKSDSYTIISKEEAFSKIDQCGLIELDTETTGFDPHTCSLLTQQFGTENDQFVIDNNISCIIRKIIKVIKQSLNDKFNSISIY